ncbi:hypothetical protein EDB89DRAFT_417155 [Lactarius sanguifluus]|nr:hypothetical protein EDB89DRAFT_417155 [Lactarius sanguifluus]
MSVSAAIFFTQSFTSLLWATVVEKRKRRVILTPLPLTPWRLPHMCVIWYLHVLKAGRCHPDDDARSFWWRNGRSFEGEARTLTLVVSPCPRRLSTLGSARLRSGLIVLPFVVSFLALLLSAFIREPHSFSSTQ